MSDRETPNASLIVFLTPFCHDRIAAFVSVANDKRSELWGGLTSTSWRKDAENFRFCYFPLKSAWTVDCDYVGGIGKKLRCADSKLPGQFPHTLDLPLAGC